MKEKKLPITNDEGNYEIRLESIGGLGANLCGKMLGQLAVKYLGLNSASFSSYGSEKTGTPVKGHIRICKNDKEIINHSPVTHPHLLCIFHEALMGNKEIFAGCNEDTVVIVNTTLPPEQIAKYCVAKKVICICAGDITIETKSRVNVVLLGAMAYAMEFVGMDDVIKVCEESLGKKYPGAMPGNIAGIKRGYEEAEKSENQIEFNREKILNRKEQLQMECDGKTARREPCMGGVNPNFGNTVTNDLSPSRQGFIPLFIKERCINCGLCDSTCPDMVFQFEEGVYKGNEMMVNQGLDYYHCKGCLRCVQVCPTNALVQAKESDYPKKPWFIPNKDLIQHPSYYEKTGPDGYITSESFLTEERFGGGEV